jgi:hypothetical protein
MYLVLSLKSSIFILSKDQIQFDSDAFVSPPQSTINDTQIRHPFKAEEGGQERGGFALKFI